jgi:hypothetical protein
VQLCDDRAHEINGKIISHSFPPSGPIHTIIGSPSASKRPPDGEPSGPH